MIFAFFEAANLWNSNPSSLQQLVGALIDSPGHWDAQTRWGGDGVIVKSPFKFLLLLCP